MRQNSLKVTFIWIKPLVFKNLALGIEELKRYITQSNEIIEYYEKAVTDKPE